jgi:hypothetical protein
VPVDKRTKVIVGKLNCMVVYSVSSSEQTLLPRKIINGMQFTDVHSIITRILKKKKLGTLILKKYENGAFPTRQYICTLILKKYENSAFPTRQYICTLILKKIYKRCLCD